MKNNRQTLDVSAFSSFDKLHLKNSSAGENELYVDSGNSPSLDETGTSMQ
jgi:hypothetical protein